MIFPRHEEAATSMAETMDMSGMDMGSSSTTNGTSMMATMMVAFQNDMFTTLYAEAWTPTGMGTYAATCIFLIFLAVAFRSMIALKGLQESRWLDAELQRRYVTVNGKLPLSERMSQDSLAKNMTLSANGVEEDVVVVKKKNTHVRPWRLSVDPVRALIDTSIVGVGYLL